MTELQFPSTSGSERQLLNEYLDWYRAAILRKIDGASDEMLRARLVPSKTTLLGIVKHLAWVEIWWFQIVFAGRDVEGYRRDDSDWDWDIASDETTQGVIELYKDACHQSRAIVEEATDLDAVSVRGRREDGKKYNLRRTLIHMIEETARHA
ncbi:MAG: DinB family protein, partial [Actinomycetota bacterium]